MIGESGPRAVAPHVPHVCVNSSRLDRIDKENSSARSAASAIGDAKAGQPTIRRAVSAPESGRCGHARGQQGGRSAPGALPLIATLRSPLRRQVRKECGYPDRIARRIASGGAPHNEEANTTWSVGRPSRAISVAGSPVRSTNDRERELTARR